MPSRDPVESPSITGLVIGGMLISLAVFALAGFILYSSVCPCGGAPGGFLFGERVQEPVNNWEFVNDAPLCQVQVWRGWRPYSVHMACMAVPDGRVYLSCIDCESDRVLLQADAAREALLRHNGRVYPVVLQPLVQEADRRQAWQLYRALWQRPEDLRRIGSIAGELPPASWRVLGASSVAP
ncbi:MAG: hypothetical protein KDI28_07885 [Pseudomonadales bacterium]|nr:hypothetical protein [Pseudomonadales bacterium]